MFYICPQLEGTGRDSLDKNLKTRQPPYSWWKAREILRRTKSGSLLVPSTFLLK